MKHLLTLIALCVVTALSGSAVSSVQANDDLRGLGCLPPDGAPSAKLTGAYLGQQPPGTTPELFAPGVVSTCKEHSAAMFTPDGKEMYFGRMFPAEILVMRQVDGGWTEPEVVSFSGEWGDLYPFLSADGRRIVFSSERPDAPGAGAGRGQLHLWQTHRTESGWSKPTRISLGLSPGTRLGCPSLDSDGKLFFSRRNDSASSDLYVASRQGDGHGMPRNLGRVVNSDQSEFSAFVAPNGSYLLFSSFRGSLGMSDLFVSFRAEDGSWTQPKNLGPKVNSGGKDEYPYVSPDGKYLFFNSNRPSSLYGKSIPDGPGNMYWVSASVIEALRP